MIIPLWSNHDPIIVPSSIPLLSHDYPMIISLSSHYFPIILGNSGGVFRPKIAGTAAPVVPQSLVQQATAQIGQRPQGAAAQLLDEETEDQGTLDLQGGAPPVISWVIIPINYRYTPRINPRYWS